MNSCEVPIVVSMFNANGALVRVRVAGAPTMRSVHVCKECGSVSVARDGEAGAICARHIHAETTFVGYDHDANDVAAEVVW